MALDHSDLKAAAQYVTRGIVPNRALYLYHSPWGRTCGECDFWRGPKGNLPRGCPYSDVHPHAYACEAFYPSSTCKQFSA